MKKARGCSIKVHLSAAEKRAVDKLCRRFWPSLLPVQCREAAVLIVLREFWREALESCS